MAKEKYLIRSYVKDRPKVLERESEEKMVVVDRGGNEVLRSATCGSDSEVSKVSPAEVIQTPYEINPGLTKQKAWELYMIYRWEKRELLELGIPENTLDTWLYQPTREGPCWKQERDIFDRSVKQKMKESAADAMGEIFAEGMDWIACDLKEARRSGRRLEKPREFKELIDSLAKLKNLINLEEGKPNTISQHVITTQEEAQELYNKLQKLDPFLQADSKGSVN